MEFMGKAQAHGLFYFKIQYQKGSKDYFDVWLLSTSQVDAKYLKAMTDEYKVHDDAIKRNDLAMKNQEKAITQSIEDEATRKQELSDVHDARGIAEDVKIAVDKKIEEELKILLADLSTKLGEATTIAIAAAQDFALKGQF